MKKADWKYLVDTLLFLSVVGIVLIGLLLAFGVAEGPAKGESLKYFMGLHRHQWSAIHLYFSLVFTGLLVVHLILAWDWIKARARAIFKNGWRTAIIITAAAALILPLIFWAATPKKTPDFRDYGNRTGDPRRPGRGGAAGPTPAPDAPAAEAAGMGIPSEPPAASGDRAEVSPPQPARNTRTIEDHAGESEDHLTRGRLDEDASGILITGRMTLRDLEIESGIPAARILEQLKLPRYIPQNETLGRLRRHFGFTMQDLRNAIETLLPTRDTRKITTREFTSPSLL